jgi:hypothetical protein
MDMSSEGAATGIGPTHRIAVIGSGNVGAAIARGAVRAGREVVLGVRSAAKAEVPAGVAVASPHEAVAGAGIVVLAVPVAALADVVPTLAVEPGTIVVDATNAVGAPVPGGHPTVAHHVAALAPHARVVKAFNTVGAEHLDGTPVTGRPTFLPVAGDDGGRADIVELARQMGFDAVDLGGMDAVVHVEDHARLWIHVAIVRGLGRDWTFTIARP